MVRGYRPHMHLKIIMLHNKKGIGHGKQSCSTVATCILLAPPAVKLLSFSQPPSAFPVAWPTAKSSELKQNQGGKIIRFANQNTCRLVPKIKCLIGKTHEMSLRHDHKIKHTSNSGNVYHSLSSRFCLLNFDQRPCCSSD